MPLQRQLGCLVSRGFLPCDFDARSLLASRFKLPRLRLCGCLSCGLPALGFLSRDFDTCRLLASRFSLLRLPLRCIPAFGLARGFDASGVLTSSLLPRRRLRRGRLRDESVLSLRRDSLPGCLTGIGGHRRDGIRARFSRRRADVRGWRRWIGREHDRLGFAGGLGVDDRRFRSPSGCRPGRLPGTRRRFRSGRIGGSALARLRIDRGAGRGNDHERVRRG